MSYQSFGKLEVWKITDIFVFCILQKVLQENLELKFIADKVRLTEAEMRQDLRVPNLTLNP